MKVAAALFACLLAGHAYGQSSDLCPRLPANAQLKWSVSRGPDFDVCRAMRGTQQVFGVYLGNHPSFRPSEYKPAGAGKIGKYEVVWYEVPSDDKSRPISRQTLLRLGQTPGADMAHVWIHAANDGELSAALAVLQGVEFK